MDAAFLVLRPHHCKLRKGRISAAAAAAASSAVDGGDDDDGSVGTAKDERAMMVASMATLRWGRMVQEATSSALRQWRGVMHDMEEKRLKVAACVRRDELTSASRFFLSTSAASFFLFEEMEIIAAAFGSSMSILGGKISKSRPY